MRRLRQERSTFRKDQARMLAQRNAVGERERVKELAEAEMESIGLLWNYWGPDRCSASGQGAGIRGE